MVQTPLLISRNKIKMIYWDNYCIIEQFRDVSNDSIEIMSSHTTLSSKIYPLSNNIEMPSLIDGNPKNPIIPGGALVDKDLRQWWGLIRFDCICYIQFSNQPLRQTCSRICVHVIILALIGGPWCCRSNQHNWTTRIKFCLSTSRLRFQKLDIHHQLKNNEWLFWKAVHTLVSTHP